MIHSVQAEGILHIEFQRPEKKNALTEEMYRQLTELLLQADQDDGVAVVLFSGAGGAYTAGNDLEDFLAHPPTHREAPVLQFLRALTTCRKPLVAAVDGVAVGVGTTMLLHCDLAYASPGARFAMPFVSLGLVPEAASSLLLPRLVGHRRAADLLFFGRPFGAEEALSLGLINAIVSDTPVLDHARSAAQALTRLPQGALRDTKALLRGGATELASGGEVVARIDLEADIFGRRVQSPAAREAFTAFQEKRKPDFRGLD